MNYLDHFGLTQPPFSITPDTEFIFPGTTHQEAINTLMLALDDGEGFLKITGEVGTGKSLLCRKLLRDLPDNFVSAFLPSPYLTPRSLFLTLADELDLNLPADIEEHRLLQELHFSLLNHANSGRRVLVCIDEAQAMPMETLESLRLLSNLETEKRKLLHIVLFGQPELDDRLSAESVRQLRQRITFHYRLMPMSRLEVGQYTAHRLRVAGHRGEHILTPRAIKGLHRASSGIARLVNILAHKSLMLAFGEGRYRVSYNDVRQAARDTEGARRLWWW